MSEVQNRKTFGFLSLLWPDSVTELIESSFSTVRKTCLTLENGKS